ncbi:MFS transporter [Phenylobacterium sp.]|uniref:MFS transporter n=1 Tax=Phenylobacterium sp. TaxID=1871053 RepID=UPI0027353AC4|nr:MFS transporter [Phenylobacterium sp.]MDP3659846.1 MFS transporter [Phenylobacterium sp.]
MTLDTTAKRRPFGLPFYFGWTIVAAGFMSMFVSNGMAFWALQVFVGPMQADTGWPRAEIMGALTVRWLVGGFGGLLVGKYFDRKHGPWIITLVGVLLDGGSMIALYWVKDPWVFILLFGVLGGVGSIGTGRLLSAVLIPKWFVAKRGLAMSIAVSGSGVSALIMSPIANAINDTAGWREGWVWMGALTIALLIPFLPFVRRAPEDMGLLPDDGAAPKPAAAGRVQVSAASERSYTLSEAMRSPTLWLLTLAMSIGLFSMSTNASSMVPFYRSLGFSAEVAAWGLAVYGVFSFLSRFVWGAVADRLSVQHAVVIQAICTSLGVGINLMAHTETMMFAAAAFQGLALGGFLVLQPLIWPAYFGRKHLGSITGMTQFLTTFAMASGPFFAGAMFDATGAYTWAYRVLIGTWLICAALTFLVRPMTDKRAAPPTPQTAPAE